MLSRIAAVLLCILFCLPVWATPERDYLAIFGTLDMPDCDWDRAKPDLLIKAPMWKPYFDLFLTRIKKEAHGRHIVIDLNVHGLNNLALYQGTMNTRNLYGEATMGYVINHIEKKLAGEDIVVCCEACFGAGVYRKSIRGNKKDKLVETEDCDHIPKFPIYGVHEDVYGWNNVVYEQYIHNIRVNFLDLRQYEYKPIKELKDIDSDSSSDQNKALSEAWVFLHSYGL